MFILSITGVRLVIFDDKKKSSEKEIDTVVTGKFLCRPKYGYYTEGTINTVVHFLIITVRIPIFY